LAAQAGDEIVFTTVLENPITPVKNQNRSGTCWDYATTGIVEAELLRKTGKVYDLSEMFIANNDYVDCAEYHVRMHGNSRFSLFPARGASLFDK
jgi:C1A family cysteine protease